ncbi:DNA-binding transcriptional regulator of sugar metabolism, DeoR/GlpR family [Pustulibacterium marinum]|uniref:DNA-binding transcriptional regulator of sugar metabolism, DeoR/GlpR family n=1 Tax=Pustulibacterium marinum TaxID=1224947 RepID=A0A1I7H7N8_9FLAO|nr:DeoR/GlpR family DNA-binding transcription regulator [Pustulibacterium marinum]SFU56718.1 DNA-binding transcriptional regulator of sugar metabolism, DeoR/GlpR family [Pustulibacterium marinum]
MNRQIRLRSIINTLEEKFFISFTDIIERFSISELDLEKDCAFLSENQIAYSTASGIHKIPNTSSTYEERYITQQQQKEIIAQKVIPFLFDGATIFMDSGSTNTFIASQIPDHLQLRIITHNVALIPILDTKSTIEVLLVGGTYHSDTQSIFSMQTMDDVSNYVADFFFLSPCALDSTYGITSTHKEEANLKRMMRLFAKKTIVTATADKLGTQQPFKVCDMDEVFALITELSSDNIALLPYTDQNALIY